MHFSYSRSNISSEKKLVRRYATRNSIANMPDFDDEASENRGKTSFEANSSSNVLRPLPPWFDSKTISTFAKKRKIQAVLGEDSTGSPDKCAGSKVKRTKSDTCAPSTFVEKCSQSNE